MKAAWFTRTLSLSLSHSLTSLYLSLFLQHTYEKREEGERERRERFRKHRVSECRRSKWKRNLRWLFTFCHLICWYCCCCCCCCSCNTPPDFWSDQSSTPNLKVDQKFEGSFMLQFFHCMFSIESFIWRKIEMV